MTYTLSDGTAGWMSNNVRLQSEEVAVKLDRNIG